jgi:two-component system CheB/CheR fusion protein
MLEDRQAGAPLRLLLIDDNPDDRALVERELRMRIGALAVRHIADAAALDAALAEGAFDVAVTDYRLRWTLGTEVLRAIKSRYPDIPVVMFTGSGNEEVAVQAMKDGLDDYITKTPKHYPRVPYAVLGCFERASNRIRLREALERESLAKARLEIALRSAGMGTWQFLPAAARFSLSPEVAAMLGRAAAALELPAQELGALVDPRDLDALRRAWDEALAAEAPDAAFSAEFRVRGADGLTRWLAVSGAVVQAEAGAPRLLIGTARDVSAAVEAREAQRRQQLELERANRQKNEFLSVLAHELRNPMAAIGYSAGMLDRNAAPETVTRAREVIGRQSAHMKKLLDDLLDLSRITHKRIELAMAPLDLRRVIEHSFDSVRPAMEALGHVARFELGPAPLRVLGDEVRLTQVMSNLLQNAAKFTPPGGRIEVSAAAEGSMAVVTVTDNGVGIPADQLERVFEMFSQAESKVSGGTPGLGIGLAVVRRLVELHGGSAHAVSEGPGRGTRIHLALPLTQAALAPDTEHEKPGGRARARLLVADDNSDAADLLADLLRLEGYEVRVAYDGRQAIEIAGSWRPQLMLLDVGMPHRSGHDVARWVRAQPWGPDVRLAALTGWGQREDKAASADAGFDLHLVKPVAPEEIVAALRQLADA